VGIDRTVIVRLPRCAAIGTNPVRNGQERLPLQIRIVRITMGSMKTRQDAAAGCAVHSIARSAVGDVAVCEGCGQVHLTLEYLTLRLEPPAFLDLAGMLAHAASALRPARSGEPAAPASAGVGSVTDLPIH
jgi:hypothetical protein